VAVVNPSAPDASLEPRSTPDGETVYVDRSAGEAGSDGPFYVAYLTPDRERRWGFCCGRCDELDNAMDSMGRIECNVCGNRRKPDRWDAAHE
jgi:hypothetical protein